MLLPQTNGSSKTYPSSLRDNWYRALEAIPNGQFLHRITACLGKIKTPYNKQRLLEQLESHLRCKDTQDKIIASLSDIDKAILTGASILSHPALRVIIDLLSIYEKAQVIARATVLLDEFVLYSFEGVLCIAPPLQEALRPYIGYHTILPQTIGSSLTNGADSVTSGGVNNAPQLLQTSGGGKAGVLLPLEECMQDIMQPGEREAAGEPSQTIVPVTSMEIASLVAFVMAHKKALKTNGAFTAAAAKDINAQFQSFLPPSYTDSIPDEMPRGSAAVGKTALSKNLTPYSNAQAIQSSSRHELLLQSMINLSLLTSAPALSFNWPLLTSFASFPPSYRAALLCAAYVVPSKDVKIIQVLSQALLDMTATARGESISSKTLDTLEVLRFEGDDTPLPTRYDFLLRGSAKGDKGAIGAGQALIKGPKEVSYRQMIYLFQDVVQVACKMGFVLLCPMCIAQNNSAGGAAASATKGFTNGSTYGGGGGDIPPSGYRFCFIQEEEREASIPLVSVDSSFTVTVMPGMSLRAMLRLVPFLTLVSAQTACVFSITRESCTRAFDMGITVEDITKTLEECTSSKMSDSLVVSLSSWYESYTAASLYRGYVLCLTEQAARRFECSPDYAKCVYKKLSAGVYLLNVALTSKSSPTANAESDSEAVRLLGKADFKSIESVEAVLSEAEKHSVQRNHPLPILHNGESIIMRGEC